MDERSKVKLGSLWKREDRNGQTYWTGALGAARLMLFPREREAGDDQPDFDIYIIPNNSPRG